MSQREGLAFPDEATLRCQAGQTALKGNLREQAALCFNQALALNPMLWEACEGLCALGEAYLFSIEAVKSTVTVL
jgi:anaphase-promoting complex subunit 3